MEELTASERVEKVIEWLGDLQTPIIDNDELGELVYTLSEGYGWKDDFDFMSPEQVIFCWQVIEKLRQPNTKLPEDCKL